MKPLQRQRARNEPGNVECVACGGSGVSSKGFQCFPCQGSGALAMQVTDPESGEQLLAIPQHSSNTVEHYTPADIVEAARSVLGGIDLDPASCALANDVVKAEAWYGPGSEFGQDGLAEPWLGRVFLNPPGGKADGRSNAARWWARLAEAWRTGEVEAAIFVGFSIEILRSAQRFDVPQPLDFPLCIPKSRIKFDNPAGPSSSPVNANVIVYLPPVDRDFRNTLRLLFGAWHRFGKTFAPIGKCRA